MSRRRDLEQHRHSLNEIREIMNSMKTLAYMESHKLTTSIPAQHDMLTSIEAVAGDFIQFHGDLLPRTNEFFQVHLLIGSERGFCGDFNEAMLGILDSMQEESAVIAVGRKLVPLIERHPHFSSGLEGASVVEEAERVLPRIVEALTSIQGQHGNIQLIAHFHDPDEAKPVSLELLPPFKKIPPGKPQFSHSPILNLSPSAFLLQLTEHYLFAALQGILYASLMAENHRRMEHLDAAVQRLDKKTEEIGRRCNVLRQEEITEEIEVILLSAASLEDLKQL